MNTGPAQFTEPPLIGPQPGICQAQVCPAPNRVGRRRQSVASALRAACAAYAAAGKKPSTWSTPGTGDQTRRRGVLTHRPSPWEPHTRTACRGATMGQVERGRPDELPQTAAPRATAPPLVRSRNTTTLTLYDGGATLSGNLDCWTANPSPLGTHWYTQTCRLIPRMLLDGPLQVRSTSGLVIRCRRCWRRHSRPSAARGDEALVERDPNASRRLRP